MSTELATLPNSGDAIMAIIQQAATSDTFDVAKMKELMEMKRDWDRDRAAEAYAVAITRFQNECPQIHKGRKVQQMGFSFASFDDVMREAQQHLTACGIAIKFSTESTDRGIRVTVTTRVGTHAEDSTLDVPVPSQLKVNDTQKYGAALSYAKRYALCAALNIVVTDEDNDAAGLGQTISMEQEIELLELLESTGGDKPRFLKFMGVEKVIDIPAKRFPEAVNAINEAAKARGRSANR